VNNSCSNCGTFFEITQGDLDFYDKVSPVFNGKKYPIPPPLLCAQCRLQRRLAHRNEKTLFKRKCDFTGGSIISVHAPDCGYKVYEKGIWWSDKWDPKEYGRDFDFSKSFFEQFESLQRAVPRMSLQQDRNENSDYTNNVSYLKNCYLLFSADYSRDSCYGIWVERSNDCFDNYLIDECERTYESFSSQCRDSAFLFDCRGCSDCIMCSGLREKQFCIENKQYSKEEYIKRKQAFNFSSYAGLLAFNGQFIKFIEGAVRPALRKHGRIIDSTGDLLTDTENCINCYETAIAKDCKNTIGFKIKDAFDCSYVSGELAYESCECFPAPFKSVFNINSYTGSELLYCDLCMNDCQNLFGCAGMKKARYCVLNKQYTKEKYSALVPKIIDHMRRTKEFGEFFPAGLSPFGYNISEAQSCYRLDKPDVLSRGWKWRDETDEIPKVDKIIPAELLPDSIDDIPDDILNWAIECEATKRPFRIVKQELEFYRRMKLPIPHFHPDERHRRRIALRNPKKLWKRNCANCAERIETSYSPDRPERVLCERCYLKEVY